MENKEETTSVIDPVYEKFRKSVLWALGSNDFYRFFMESIARADNSIQFSNRKEVKTIDPLWIERIEAALDGFQHVVSLPRQEIREEELIVNVAHAKKTGEDVVRHLASHASMVDDYNGDTGDVTPNRLMQKYREDSIGLYENRLVFTSLEMAHHFVKIRHDALFEAMSDEFGAKLKVRSDMDSATEHVHMESFLHIKNTASILDTDAKNREIFDRHQPAVPDAGRVYEHGICPADGQAGPGQGSHPQDQHPETKPLLPLGGGFAGIPPVL